MADFDAAMPYVFDNEKGFSNRSTDKGGATNLGVTQKQWEAYVGHAVTIDDMKALTQEMVKPFYKQEFWDRMRLTEIVDQSIATAMMDEAVNNGPGHAGRLAQLACGMGGKAADGTIGTASVAWINKIPRKNFFVTYIPMLQEHYIDIVIKDPVEIANLKGWLHRSQKLVTLL